MEDNGLIGEGTGRQEGEAEFLFPEGTISPVKDCPPWMMNLSMCAPFLKVISKMKGELVLPVLRHILINL